MGELAANQNLPSRGRYISELLVLWVFTLCCWTAYRFVSSPYIEPMGSVKFYLGSLIFQPIIWLPPIFLYWKLVRKEKTSPVRSFLNNDYKKSYVFRALVIGTILVLAELILQFIRSYAIFNSGLFSYDEIKFYWFHATDSWIHYLAMALTNLLIIATIEEFFFRGFLQNQFERVLPKWQSLGIASVLFGLSHLPIAIVVYEMEGLLLVYSLIQWIGAGLVFGYAYQIFRNIWVCIFYHGLHNVMVFTFYWDFVGREKVPSDFVQFSIGTLSLIVLYAIMMLLLCISRKKIVNA